MKQKKLPAYAVVLLDIALTLSILAVFCYFHHIRILWGESRIDTVVESIKKPESSSQQENVSSSPPEDSSRPQDENSVNDSSEVKDDSSSEPEEKYDTSGDFGAALGDRFLTEQDKKVSLTDNKEILDYCQSSGLELPELEDCSYIGLYRSRDLLVTVGQVDTYIVSEYSGEKRIMRYFVFDVYVRNIENLFTQTDSGRLHMKDMVAKGEAYTGFPIIAAINGDYLGNTNHCLVAERNGEVLLTSDYLSSDICVLYYDGSMETVEPSEYDWEEIRAAAPYQIWDFGPGLLTDSGEAISDYDSSAYDKSVISSRHPRAGLGYYEPGHYCFVSVDGRSDYSAGMKMTEFARLFEQLGCVQAYNMDGGNSSQSYYNGRIVRQAVDNGDGQRKLYDIICVGEVR